MLYWRGFLEAIHSCSKQGKLSRWLRAIFSEDLRISIDGEFKTTLCSLPQSPNKKFSFFLIIFFSIPTCVQCPYCASVRRAFPILSVPCYEEVIGNIKVSPWPVLLKAESIQPSQSLLVLQVLKSPHGLGDLSVSISFLYWKAQNWNEM